MRIAAVLLIIIGAGSLSACDADDMRAYQDKAQEGARQSLQWSASALDDINDWLFRVSIRVEQAASAKYTRVADRLTDPGTIELILGATPDTVEATQAPLTAYRATRDQTQLLGRDADNDGVRDDLDFLIRKTATSDVGRQSMMRLAGAVQLGIRAGRAGAGKAEVKQAIDHLAAASDCALYQAGRRAVDQVRYVEIMALDTDGRATAYRAFNRKAATLVERPPKTQGASCGFSPARQAA